MALIGGIFIVVFLKNGTDAALKVWAALGTLIGVLTGAIPTYFFQQAHVEAAQSNVQAAQSVAAAARSEAGAERDRADRAEAQYRALAGAADPTVVDRMEKAHPDLFAR